MVLQSWKWTWSPVLLLFDTIKTNVYCAHVLLCADYNERKRLQHDSPDYLRPHSAKEFYRILGLQMMDWRGETLPQRQPGATAPKPGANGLVVSGIL